MADSLEARLKDAADRFPIGRKVRFYPVLGLPECITGKVRSKPWALGHGAIVVAIEGKAGGVHLDHLEVV